MKQVLGAPVAPVRRHRHAHQPPFSRGVSGQFPQLQRHRLSGDLPGEGDRGRLGPEGRDAGRTWCQSDDPELPALRRQRRPGWRDLFLRLAQAAHRPHAASPCATPTATTTHGRIYRITYEGRPLLKPAKIDGQPIARLLDLLKEPENRRAERAKIELGKHDSGGGDRGRQEMGGRSIRTTRPTSTT